MRYSKVVLVLFIGLQSAFALATPTTLTELTFMGPIKGSEIPTMNVEAVSQYFINPDSITDAQTEIIQSILDQKKNDSNKSTISDQDYLKEYLNSNR